MRQTVTARTASLIPHLPSTVNFTAIMAYLRPPSAAQRIIFCSTVHGYVDPENKPVRTDRRGLRMLSSKEWLQQGASVIPAVLCLPLHVSTLITLAGRVSSYLHEHELFFHILDDGSESKVELAKECTVDSLRIDGPSTVLLRHLDIRPELLLKEDSEKTNRRAHYSPQLLVGLRAWYEAAYRELEGSEKEQRPFRCLTVWRPDEDWFTQPPPLPYAFVSGRRSSSLTSSFPPPTKLCKQSSTGGSSRASAISATGRTSTASSSIQRIPDLFSGRAALPMHRSIVTEATIMLPGRTSSPDTLRVELAI